MKLYNKIVCIVFILLSACNSSQVKPISYSDKTSNNSILDTSEFAIIPLNRSNNYIFDSSYLPAELNESEIVEVKDLLYKSIREYNSSRKKENPEYDGLDTAKFQYNFQLVPALNKKGEKEVWINAFCLESDLPMNWKKEVIIVDDGGDCFFQLKINLTQKKYYNFIVNGLA